MYEKLFTPMKIGAMEIKNRLMMSAMDTYYVGSDGICNERMAQYLITRAKGGWGLIVTEMTRVSADSGMPILGMYNDAQEEAFKPVVAEIHKYGSKLLMQLVHPGRRETKATRTDASLAPSVIAVGPGTDLPREMTTEEVWVMIEQYISAAQRAQRAGFDGVEIHLGHAWLLSSFLSPISNKRLDEFGGSIAARAKIAVEIIKGIKARCGKDFVVTAKLSTQEYVDGGLGIEESKVMAWMFEKAGLDAIHCSQGIFLSNYKTNPPSCTPRGAYLENARAIKSVVHIPVIAVGRINDPDLAECILETTNLDMISMARASLADPDFPNKVQENRVDDIIRCVGCLQMCLGCDPKAGMSCMLNLMTGREWQYSGQKTKQRKKVYVAGGGVSGCEAAIAAAEKGHQVELFEASGQLGGQWLAARIPVGKEEFGAFLKWQKRRMEQLGVEVHLNTALTKAKVETAHPDAVLIATGAKPFVPPIKGVENGVLLANDVLLGQINVGKQVVVIGGGLVGAELADQLSFYGSDVTIIEMMDAVAKEAQKNVRHELLERLEKRHVRLLTGVKVVEIGDGFVTVENKDGVQETLLDVDSAVLAVGSRPVCALKEELQDYTGTVKVIGDTAKVKLGSDNITEAFLAGYTL